MNAQRNGAELSTAHMVAGMESHAADQAVETDNPGLGDDAFAGDQPTSADSRPVANGAPAASTAAGPAGHTPLLSEDKAATFRTRWDTIQASFVDEPRQSVEQADYLVDEAIKQLAEVFAQERSTLEEQWHRGDEVSTDALRLGLQRYRSFFQRLLAV